MDSMIGGEDICCPYCKKKIIITINNHKLDDKSLDVIQEKLRLEE